MEEQSSEATAYRKVIAGLLAQGTPARCSNLPGQGVPSRNVPWTQLSCCIVGSSARFRASGTLGWVQFCTPQPHAPGRFMGCFMGLLSGAGFPLSQKHILETLAHYTPFQLGHKSSAQSPCYKRHSPRNSPLLVSFSEGNWNISTLRNQFSC